jgi:hypothetical protein
VLEQAVFLAEYRLEQAQPQAEMVTVQAAVAVK